MLHGIKLMVSCLMYFFSIKNCLPSVNINMLILLITERYKISNKVDVQFPHISVWKLHTQACEIVGGTKRKLCKKFQVDIY